MRYGGAFHYNPVTLAQYALTMHGRYTRGDHDALNSFLNASRKLLELQEQDGAFRYQFPYRYYLTGELLRPGWISGMAQGQAMSVFARAYLTTKDRQYLSAGNRALDFLLKPIQEGGPRSTLRDFDSNLSHLLFFEEYVSTPNNYTLNGYMFALLGLYDWSEIQRTRYGNVNQASRYFQKGIKTLNVLLPYYDIDGFTAYDLGHYVVSKKPHILERYHVVHLSLLQALSSVTKSDEIADALCRWTNYVE